LAHTHPSHGFNQNQIWCELVAMAYQLLAWMQALTLERPARAWEPNGCGCAYSAQPGVSPAAADGCGFASGT
jgi:hypothetical protein